MTARPDDTSQIAYEAAHAALEEFVDSSKFRASMEAAITISLQRVGIDTVDTEAMRRDMVHLRTWREFMEFVQKRGVGAAVTWTVTALLGLLVIGAGSLWLHR